MTGCVHCGSLMTRAWSLQAGFGGLACSSHCLRQYEEGQKTRAAAKRIAPRLSSEQVELLGSFLDLGGYPGRTAGCSREMPRDEAGKVTLDALLGRGLVHGPQWADSALISLTRLGEYTLDELSRRERQQAQ